MAMARSTCTWSTPGGCLSCRMRLKRPTRFFATKVQAVSQSRRRGLASAIAATAWARSLAITTTTAGPTSTSPILAPMRFSTIAARVALPTLQLQPTWAARDGGRARPLPMWISTGIWTYSSATTSTIRPKIRSCAGSATARNGSTATRASSTAKSTASISTRGAFLPTARRLLVSSARPARNWESSLATTIKTATRICTWPTTSCPTCSIATTACALSIAGLPAAPASTARGLPRPGWELIWPMQTATATWIYS